MQSKPPILSPHMSAVHVPIQFLVISALGVDVPHEGTAGGCLVRHSGHDQPNTDILASDPMDLVVDEAVRSVHLAPGLAIGAFERILALKGLAAVEDTHIAMPAIGDRGSSESGKPAELAGIDLRRDVGCHVDGRVVGLCDIIVRQGLRFGDDGDLDMTVYRLARDGGCSHSRVER